MMTLPSGGPELWWWGLSVVWTIVGLWYISTHSTVLVSDKTDGFPCSLSQFVLTLIFLCVAGALYFGSFFVAQKFFGIAEWPSNTIVPDTHGSSESMVRLQLVALAITTVLYFLLQKRLPASIASLVVGEVSWKSLLKGLTMGVLLTPCVFLFTWLIGVCSTIFYHEPKAPQLALSLFGSLPPSSTMFWVMFVVVVTLVPFVEETLFRGFLLSFFSGLLHPVLSVFATSAVFAAFHYSPLQMGSNPEILAGLFLFSVFVSNLKKETHSLWTAIGFHAAFNAASLILFMELS